MTSPSLCYSREDLLRLRSSTFPISRSVKRKLWFLRLTNNAHTCSLPHVRPPSRRVTSHVPQTCARAVKARPTSDSLKLRVLRPLSRADRHCKPTHLSLTLGLLNIRSLANKVDDVIALRRDQAIDVLFLVETWHDSDSVSVRLLRSAGLTVLDRPRTRKRHDTLTTNHGGVAVVSVPGVHVKRLHSPNSTTFEYLSVRLSSRSTSCTALLIYRTGPVSSLFFTELANTLDLLVTLNEPIFIIGDLNIHVENHNDHHAKTLLSLLDAYGLTCRVSGPTHDLGGTLDIVASRSDLPPPPVDVRDPVCLIIVWSDGPRPYHDRSLSTIPSPHVRGATSTTRPFAPPSPPRTSAGHRHHLHSTWISRHASLIR